jgi:phospholipid N-methyltransferase
MKRHISEYSTFFREFRRTFDTTGALAPSGRLLARAIVQPLREHDRPVRILEVGAGTGAVTKEIVRHVAPGDRLHVVELNDRFVEVLRRRFDSEPGFREVAAQTEIIHAPVQELETAEPYDFIVCGVPFNNFSTELVKSIFRHMMELLGPGGTLSFFEYLWIRRFKMLVATPEERRRVARVGCVLKKYLEWYECDRDTVYVNVPPAVAHHLRIVTNGKLVTPHGAAHD